MKKVVKMRSKLAFKNIFSTLILQIIILVYGFVVPKLIIKSFGSDVNGLLSSISQFLSYITLLEAGLCPVVRSALYKPISKKDNKQIINILKAAEKFFRLISLIFIIYLIGLSLIYPLIIQSEFSYLYTFSLIVIIAISTFFEYYFGITYSLYLYAEQKKYIISYIQIVTYILNIIAVFALIKMYANIQIIKLISGILFVMRPIILNIYVKRKFNINLKQADKNYKLEKRWDGLSQHIAAIIHDSTDVAILTIFTKLSEISVYSVYAMVTRGINSIVLSLTGGIDASFGDMIAKDEKEALNKNFNLYEFGYLTIITIIYLCTLILIVPFVEVYTLGITDANYIRYLFGTLLVISWFVHAIRAPYNMIVLAAGHFKETKKGAWLEAITNVLLSVILVSKFGIIGVAIGTLVATSIRTIEYIYHTNKYILDRNVIVSVKKIFIIVIELFLVIIIFKFIPFLLVNNSYLNWLINAVFVFLITSLIVLSFNCVIYRKEFKEILKILKKIIKK